MLSSKEEFPVIYIDIFWKYVDERLCIDLSQAQKNPEGCLTSHEIWDDGIVTYRPCVSYCRDAEHGHVFKLEYRASDHPELAGCEVYWGTSTVTVLADLQSATVYWKGDPYIPKMDGEPDRGCSIRSEKPSAKRGVFATARAAQKQFKEKLLKLGRECAISGEKLEALLDAAHIQSVKDGGPDEVNNGILLRADLHRLYDAGLFNIETDGAISRHKDLPAFYRQELREKKISPDIVNRIRPYLRRHKAVPRAHLFVE